MAKKRIFAYIFDFLLMIIILNFFTNYDINELNVQLNEITDQYFIHEINFSTYFYNYSLIMHDITEIQINSFIISIFYILIYHILVPYFFDGQTIGYYIFKIRRTNKEDKITLKSLIRVSLIVNGLGYALLSLILFYIIPDNYYFPVISFLAFIQICLVIQILFMVLYKGNKLTIHEKISQTFIEEVK